jgi:hypothetical protein
VLVSQLKGVIHKLISKEQSTYLAGLSILDGPLILNELISWLKKSKLLKVDMEKSFDLLTRGFLDSVMLQMNFPMVWRSCIKAILSSSRASVLINGSPTQDFASTRGLRQGDPLSPFVFILAMEARSYVIKRACSTGLFSGILCASSGPIVSHFIFADDVVFVGEWSEMNARNIRRILRCFF